MFLIIVLDEGALSSRGRTAQLLARRGLYDRLYLTQFAGQWLVGTGAEASSMHPPLRHSEGWYGC